MARTRLILDTSDVLLSPHYFISTYERQANKPRYDSGVLTWPLLCDSINLTYQELLKVTPANNMQVFLSCYLVSLPPVLRFILRVCVQLNL